MTQLKYLPLMLGMLLTACGQNMVKASPPAEGTPPGASESSEPVKQAGSVPVPVVADNLPKLDLTPDIFYQFLLAEIAGQRGEIGLAKTAYLDLARKTRDPRLARRAAEISVFARDQEGALEATRLWSETDQDSERASQTLAALLLAQGKLTEAEPVLRRLLANDAANGFMQIPAMLANTRDTQASFDMVQRLAAGFPALAEAQFATAQVAIQAGKNEQAAAALQNTEKLRPGWEPAAVYRAQWLAKTSRADALGFMRDFLASYPQAREVRLAYARLLVHANQYPEARSQFNRLTSDFPRNADVSLAAGLLSLQMGDTQAALDLLTQTLAYGYKDPDTVHYYLGLVTEELKQPEVAAKHYQEVRDGEFLVRARSRQASLLARQGKMGDARSLLSSTLGDNDAQRVLLVQAEAELLRDAKDYASAFQVLSDGVKRYPDASDLLYDQAMMAEKVGKLDVLETNLRRVIELKPDAAQAYNALGYTLADRTTRLDEAVGLLDKALSLAPDDPFILDSMGWAQYRKGNFVRAREFLDRAYKARPDPEIAAHLGEVMWVYGKHDDATVLWQASLKNHPQNEVLLETVRRLKP
jgi:tetratricopeptide (TPR) repeat protein